MLLLKFYFYFCTLKNCRTFVTSKGNKDTTMKQKS